MIKFRNKSKLKSTTEKEKRSGISKRLKEEEILKVNKISKFFTKNLKCGESPN